MDVSQTQGRNHDVECSSMVLLLVTPNLASDALLLCSLAFACDEPSGIYYWQNASRNDRAKVRLETTDDNLTTELFITGVSPATNLIRRVRHSLGGGGRTLWTDLALPVWILSCGRLVSIIPVAMMILPVVGAVARSL